MKLGTGQLLVENGTIFDGTGGPVIRNGAVLIRDGKIAYAGHREGLDLTGDVPRVDASGGTIMPGLIESHFHATYFNVAHLEDLDIKYPVEYVSLLASVNAQLRRLVKASYRERSRVGSPDGKFGA
jgi:imidazolonepropionase-like amidohydrolase